MSSIVLKDKIIMLLASIINESKSETLILSELHDLLLQLKNITVFNGLQLFIDIIQSKPSFENQKIKIFLAHNLESFSLFPPLFNFINAQHLDVQESVVLEETTSPESEKADYKDITDELKEELKVGGGLRTRVEIADEESEIVKAQLREEMGAILGSSSGDGPSTIKPPKPPKPPKLPDRGSSNDKPTLPPMKSSSAALFSTNPPPSPSSRSTTKSLFNPPRNPEPQPKTPSKVIQEEEEKDKKSKGKEKSEKRSLKKEKEALSKEQEEILLDESKRKI